MARSFILGGVSATGLATGKPFIKRIVLTDSTGTGRNAAGVAGGGETHGPLRGDGLTCKVVTTNVDAGGHVGKLSFSTVDVGGANDITKNDGRGKNWTTTGELLFVEFPATTRTLSVQLEDANEKQGDEDIRCKVMLSAPDQVVASLDSNGVATSSTDTMQPLTNKNFIEIREGEIATINARTKGVFILVEKFVGTTILTTAGIETARGGTTDAEDGVSLLVTAILDHEGFQGSNGVETGVIGSAGTVTASQRKIWPLGTNGSDGIG